MVNLAPEIVASINRRLAVEIDMNATIAALAPHWSNGRRPDFWADDDVRRALTLLHRRFTIDQATAAVLEIYGPSRAPAKSSVARYWLVLDEAFGRRAGDD